VYKTFHYMTPERELVVSCSRIRLAGGTVERIRELTAGPLDWRRVVEIASDHRVLPLLDLNLRRSDAVIPQTISKLLTDQLRSNAFLNLQALAEVHELTELLRSVGIPCACLKGPALAVSAYGNINLRQFSDLDILIRKADLESAVELLMTRGYSLAGPSAKRGTGAILADNTEYHLVMIAPNHPRALELHWSLGNRFFGFDLGEAVWERLQPISTRDVEIFALPAEEELLHLAVHGAKHDWSQLVWICDVSEHILAHPELDWSHLLTVASRLGYQRMLLLSLKLAKELLECPLPEDIRTEIDREPSLNLLVAGVARQLFEECDPRSIMEKNLEHELFRLAVHVRIRDKMRYCFELLRIAANGASMLSFPTMLRWFRLTARYAPQFLRMLSRGRIARAA
jgi:Uncharacterised nucleotidyltransferase